MAYKGVVKGNVIELEEGAVLPDGTRVSVIPEPPSSVSAPGHAVPLTTWLWKAHQLREQIPKTSDSVEILQQLREERARQ